MTEPLPGPDKLKSALSSASVRSISDEANIAIFGGGRGGLAILKVLSYFDWVNIHAIVDIDADAPAFELAAETDVPIITDVEAALELFEGNIIIDVTGDADMAETLKTIAHERKLELISGKSAKLMFDLVDSQLHSRDTIRRQNTRLGMLDSMLEITRLLEDHPTLSEVANKSFKYLHGQMKAVRGLAVIFDYDGVGEIVGAIGVDKPSCDPSTCDELQAVYTEVSLFFYST